MVLEFLTTLDTLRISKSTLADLKNHIKRNCYAGSLEIEFHNLLSAYFFKRSGKNDLRKVNIT